MIQITYSDFDEMIEKIDNCQLPSSYKYPSINEAENLLINEENLYDVLLAAEKTDDKEYSKILNDLIKENVEFIESKAEEIDPDSFADQQERIKYI